MLRVPLLAGSRIPVVSLPDDVVLLAPPPPLDPLADVGAAVAAALRYPLAGPALAGVATRGGRATIVVEPPSLPLPGAADDPRRDALSAVIDELERAGVAPERHTVLVAGGLERRASRAQLERLLRPARARDFRGTVVTHDCEADDLVALTSAGGVSIRAHRAVVETDLVVCVSAAETVLRGGPATLLGACGAGAIRAATADSLLEAGTARGWRLATAAESAVAADRPVLGVSLVLDLPRASGPHDGYPWAPGALEELSGSGLRKLLNAAPDAIRRRLLQRSARELRAVAVLAGRPSVAHAEALLRAIELRGIPLDGPLDAIVVPLPWKGLHQSREPLDAISAAAVGLGLALRLWREHPPLVEGGTVVLLHPFPRTVGHGPQAPYRDLFAALRELPGERLRRAEAVAARDRRAIAAYRAGRAPHPRLPYADWESCAPVLARAGRVIVAGCRDAGAARALGFVPSHNPATALEMARGLAGERGRIGVLLAPPYAPLVVGSGDT